MKNIYFLFYITSKAYFVIITFNLDKLEDIISVSIASCGVKRHCSDFLMLRMTIQCLTPNGFNGLSI